MIVYYAGSDRESTVAPERLLKRPMRILLTYAFLKLPSGKLNRRFKNLLKTKRRK